MRTWAFVVTGSLVLVLTAIPGAAQTGTADLERVQKTLKEMGHDPGPIDGVMGSQTSAALRAYQKQHGLDATGQLDAATQARLGAPPQPSAQPRTTGGDTRPNAVDPAQATKTGANVGEGASYSRSNEKGLSTK